MFDGLLPTEYRSDVPARFSARPLVSRSVVIGVILALLGGTVEIMIGADAAEGPPIEFIGP